jgi:secreted trypsin-like serine protease
VVGGQPAPAGSFPYVADVYIGGAFGCTGTLIAPQWVMTAGHCGSATGSASEGLAPTPASWPASFYSVQLGTVYADGHGGETHSVSQVVVDSDYIVTNGSGNDVTLLKLDQPTRIKPMLVAAAGERTSWRPGVLATIAGFGTTSQADNSAPTQMRYARVPITTDAYCSQAYPNGLSEAADDGSFDPATMLCAGYPQGGTDTCQGDSGGPLLVPVGHDFRLVGATSFGAGCGQPGKPGVYARVAEGPIKTFLQRFVPQAFAPPPTAQPTKPKPKPPKKKKRPPKHHRKHHGH